MKKILKRLFAFIGAAFIAIQFFGPAKTNPPVDETKTIQMHAPMPPEVSAIIERSCYDCHSHQTRWPWYSHLEPVSWFLVDHVIDGRKHLNFSEWGSYNAKRMHHKLEEIDEQVKTGEMPLKSYLPLHPAARLSPEDVRALLAWAAAERQRVAEANNLSNDK